MRFYSKVFRIYFDFSKKNSLGKYFLRLFKFCVDHIKVATSYYTNGGWIKISPKTFIRPTGSSQKLVLTNATNIPCGPEKLHFNSSIEWRYFSLHFPTLLDLRDSKKSMLFELTSLIVDAIDLIEAENGTENDFNFYDIQLNDETKKSKIY